MSTYFLQRSHYLRSASAKFAAIPFFYPLQLLLGGLLIDAEAGQCALQPQHTVPPVRMLSKMVKKPWRSLLWLPGTFSIAPSSSPRKAVWLPTWLTSWELQIVVNSGVNYFSRQIMGLSDFHDILLTIILHFGSYIGDRHHRGEISLIRGRLFSYFAFCEPLLAAISPRPCHGRPSWQFPGPY